MAQGFLESLLMPTTSGVTLCSLCMFVTFQDNHARPTMPSMLITVHLENWFWGPGGSNGGGAHWGNIQHFDWCVWWGWPVTRSTAETTSTRHESRLDIEKNKRKTHEDTKLLREMWLTSVTPSGNLTHWSLQVEVVCCARMGPTMEGSCWLFEPLGTGFQGQTSSYRPCPSQGHIDTVLNLRNDATEILLWLRPHLLHRPGLRRWQLTVFVEPKVNAIARYCNHWWLQVF